MSDKKQDDSSRNSSFWNNLTETLVETTSKQLEIRASSQIICSAQDQQNVNIKEK